MLGRSERFYDLTGSLTFISCTVFTLLRSWDVGQRQLLASAMVFLWATRLGSFLFLRVNKANGRDRRFDRIRTRPLVFFVVWMIQAVWAFVCGLPVYLVNLSSGSSLGWLDFLGVAIWLFGFVFEIKADSEK